MATQSDTHLATIIGANIAFGRQARKMTQQQLATELQTSISRVSGWERGKHLPHRKQHQLLAELLFDGDVSALYRDDSRAAA
jgi:DNA-binding transcriptional regulator YiaG